MSENNIFPGVETESETIPETKQSLTDLATDLNQASVTVQPVTVTETESPQASEPVEEKKLIASEVERFGIKTESRVLKALSNIFEEQTNLVSEDQIIQEEKIGVCDPAHVCMCIALTTRGKIILRRFFNPEVNPKVPTISFKDDEGRVQPGNTMFSTNYFLDIMKVINEVSDHFRIIEGTDNAGIIETEDFRFLLAPRIESE